MKDRPIQAQAGLAQGRQAVFENAAARNLPVSPQYAQMLRDQNVFDSVASDVLVEGTQVNLPSPQGVSMSPLPLETYERYNLSIDPKMFVTNTAPINQTETSIVNQALAPIRVVPHQANPTTKEQMKGGIVASGRGAMFMAERMPSEVQNVQIRPQDLDPVTKQSQIVTTETSIRSQQKEYAAGVAGMSQRYKMDPSSIGLPDVGAQQELHGDTVMVPVVDSNGHPTGHMARVPAPQKEESNAFGFAIQSMPVVNPVPQVRVDNYPGMQSYVESGRAPHKKHHEAPDHKDKVRKTRKDMSPWEFYKDAWTCADKTPGQQALVVVTILVGVALLVLFVWFLVVLARPRRLARATVVEPRYQFSDSAPTKAPVDNVEASWLGRRYQ